MSQNFEFVARLVRLPLLAAVLLVAPACGRDEPLSPNGSDLPESGTLSDPVEDPAMASVSFAGGVPMGLFHLPLTDYGSRYNGSLRTPSVSYVLKDLALVKSRGGKMMLNLSGSQKYFKDRQGHFSLEKWKARVNRFRNVNFSSYIKDGTIIGHYLIDEPYDAHNFAGQRVSAATLDAMAKYSKQLWPEMATIVRGEPYKIGGTYRYLDAAWAQYLQRKGNVKDYIAQNVATAKRMGLQLVVGLNIQDGGRNMRTMSPSQIVEYGSALLNAGYACAFISWKHTSELNNSGMRSAMDALRRKAQSHGLRRCK